jgi:hypothetical protein
MGAYGTDIQQITVYSDIPLINLTKFNRQANIAYISARAAPDL